jgi:sugar/nucleoside kinase (ribokinase family)
LALTDEIAVYPGGNALNTAIALRRLGEPAAIAGSVGDDALGGLLLDQLQSLGLETRGVRREPQGRTATTIILRAEGEDRRFIHALGVAADFTGEHVSADILPDNGIVLVGEAQALRRAGAGTAVITRGQQGLYADDGDRTVEMSVFDVPLVDPSGCGDCFAAGLLAALGRGWDLVRVLEFASAVGALGATALGCTNGVPSFAEVGQFVKENELCVSVNPCR